MEFIKGFSGFINSAFIFFFLFFCAVHFIQFIVTLFKSRATVQKSKILDYKKFSENECIPLTIVVPVYNDAGTVVDTIKRLMQIEYKNYEIIVVNDGSNDNSHQNIISQFALEDIECSIKQTVRTKHVRRVSYNPNNPSLMYIEKVHGGKGDAINCGINASQCPTVICVEPGSEFDSDAILRLADEFSKDSATVASCGSVRVENSPGVSNNGRPESGLAYVQGVQIAQSIRLTAFDKAAGSSFCTLFSKSGVFGIFNKQAVFDCGGYRADSDGSSYDLILKIHRYMNAEKRVYKIAFNGDVVCSLPYETSSRFIFDTNKRWQGGMIDTLLKNFTCTFNPRHGSFGLLLLPYNWFYNLLFVFFEVLAYITLPLAVIAEWMSGTKALYLFCGYIFFNIILTMCGYIIDSIVSKKYISSKICLRLLMYSALEVLGFRQFCMLARFSGIFGYFGYRSSFKQHEPEKNKIRIVTE